MDDGEGTVEVEEAVVEAEDAGRNFQQSLPKDHK